MHASHALGKHLWFSSGLLLNNSVFSNLWQCDVFLWINICLTRSSGLSVDRSVCHLFSSSLSRTSSDFIERGKWKITVQQLYLGTLCNRTVMHQLTCVCTIRLRHMTWTLVSNINRTKANEWPSIDTPMKRFSSHLNTRGLSKSYNLLLFNIEATKGQIRYIKVISQHGPWFHAMESYYLWLTGNSRMPPWLYHYHAKFRIWGTHEWGNKQSGS